MFNFNYDLKKQNLIIIDSETKKKYELNLSKDYSKRIFGKSTNTDKIQKFYNLEPLTSIYHSDICNYLDCIQNLDYTKILKYEKKINNWVDACYKCYIFNIERYSNVKKTSKNSVYITPDNMIILLKMIIKSRFLFPLLDENAESNRKRMIFSFFHSSDEEKEVLDKIFHVVRLQIQKAEAFNSQIWYLFYSKFGFNNISFILEMYNKVINEFFVVYDLDKDVNPLGFVTSFIDNQIRWWMMEFHPEIKQIDPEKESLTDIILSLNTDDQDIYSEFLVGDFVLKINKLYDNIEKDNDEKEFMDNSKIVMSIVSKIATSYVLSQLFQMTYNDSYRCLNDMTFHKKLLLILKHVIDKHEKKYFDIGLNFHPTFSNIFTLLFTYYYNEKEEKVENMYNKIVSKTNIYRKKSIPLVNKYMSNIKEFQKLFNITEGLKILTLIDSELSGINIKYYFKVPCKTIYKHNTVQRVPLVNLYEDERCKKFIVDIVSSVVECSDNYTYNFKSTFDQMRIILTEWLNLVYIKKSNLSKIKEYKDTKIFEDVFDNC